MTDIIVPSYERFDADGLELVVNTTTGKAYASKSATARMLKIDEKTVRNQIASGDNYTVINAQIPTDAGLRSSDLLSADVVFKLAQKYSPSLAEAMGSTGANLYLLNLAGYKAVIQQFEIPATYGQALLEASRLAIELEKAEETIEEMKPIYDAVKARPNLYKSLTISLPTQRLLLAAANEIWTSLELVNEFELETTSHSVGRHLAANWRGQMGTKVPQKTVLRRNKAGKLAPYRSLGFPLDWAFAELSLIYPID